MPGFPQITAKETTDLINYLQDKETQKTITIETLHPEPWMFTGYKKFLDSEGVAAISPPWGLFSAVDLNTGELKWQIPFGNVEKYSTPGGPPTGIENYGGPIVTAGGVLIITATKDKKIRAF